MKKKEMLQIMKLITFGAFMLWGVFNYKVFIELIGLVITLSMPILIGIAIAFIINIPMKKIEEKIFKIRKRKRKKLIRGISLVVSILLILGIISLILFLVIPELIQAIISIAENIPKSYEWASDGLDKLNKLYPEIEEYIGNVDIKSIIDKSVSSVGDVVSLLIGFITSTITSLVSFFISFVIAIYILIDKENLSRQSKKVLFAFLGEKTTSKIIDIVKTTNTTFTNFLTGQCLDACLIGFLLFVILNILHLPYAIILGVLFAVTALIPYIGAFITLAIGIILIGVINPVGALWYAIVFLVLQQFDENFTYPRIVGGSVGLPALFAILAVLIGGSIFGFIGMIISIPIVSILYSLFKKYVNERLESRKENYNLDNK